MPCLDCAIDDRSPGYEIEYGSKMIIGNKKLLWDNKLSSYSSFASMGRLYDDTLGFHARKGISIFS